MNEQFHIITGCFETQSKVLNGSVLVCFFIISICFVIIACNNNRVSSNDQKLSTSDTLIFKGCPDKIKAKVGSIIEMQLEAVPATGYEWLLRDSPLLLTLNKTDLIKYTTSGEHRFQILHFRAIKKGKELIRLEYKRLFEKGAEKSCDSNIEIK